MLKSTDSENGCLMDLKDCILGKYNILQKVRSINGVAVRDGELILWGMKAMAEIVQ